MTVNIAKPILPRPTVAIGNSQRLYLREEELDAGLDTIFEAVAVLRASTQDARASHQLTWLQARTLAALVRSSHGVLSLSKLLEITKQSAIKMVKDLEDRGLVTRQDNPRDARRRTIVLTTSGQALARDVSAAMRSVLARAYRQAGGDAVAGCDSVLTALPKIAKSLTNNKMKQGDIG